TLHAPALLPNAYVPDVSQRLGFYKELSSASSVEDIIRTTEALADRYGKLPEAAARLTQIHRLRLRCEAIGVRKIDCADTATVMTFTQRPNIEPMALIRFLQSRRDARMMGPDRLRIDAGGATPEKRLMLVQTVLSALEAK
ncbi:MAG: TRCF domain-containing protein, partial [Sutterella sp.]